LFSPRFTAPHPAGPHPFPSHTPDQIKSALQGHVEIVTERERLMRAESVNQVRTRIEATTSRSPFLQLPLDIPQAPLFKDKMDRTIVPQVRRLF